MRRFNIACAIGGAAMAVLSMTSCVSRTENLDNINVITKPYSLLFADAHGTLYSTYDGQKISIVPGTQGVPMMGLSSTDKYILMRPNQGSLFVDDGGEGKNRNFNPSYMDVNPASFGPTFVLNIPNYNDTGAVIKDRLYVASSSTAGRGLAYSDSNGLTRTSWLHETDVALEGVTSLALLDNRTVVAFDDVSRRVYMKANLKTFWARQGAAGLPAAGTGNMFVLSHKNDILAVMINDINPGVWRSTDLGQNFTAMPAGLPADVSCAISAFGKVVIVGCATNGIWRLSGQGVWENSSIGLKSGSIVYGLAAKNNKFKNDKSGEYVYAATSDGLYRSDNLGQNWVKVEGPSVRDIVLIH